MIKFRLSSFEEIFSYWVWGLVDVEFLSCYDYYYWSLVLEKLLCRILEFWEVGVMFSYPIPKGAAIIDAFSIKYCELKKNTNLESLLRFKNLL